MLSTPWNQRAKRYDFVIVGSGYGGAITAARLATAKERERLWPEVVTLYSGYRDYQERTGRQIPLVVLEPRGGGR